MLRRSAISPRIPCPQPQPIGISSASTPANQSGALRSGALTSPRPLVRSAAETRDRDAYDVIMETAAGENCTDCISAKATTVTRSGVMKLDPCKNCEKNNSTIMTKSRDEKVNRQIRHLQRKNSIHLNGVIKPGKDPAHFRQNGTLKSATSDAPIINNVKKTTRNSVSTVNSATDHISPMENSSNKTKPADSILCKWLNCDRYIDASDMMNHLREVHVDTQSSSEMFVCLWTGCKVYDKTSCSLSWLERHVLSHSGAKPFKCLFDGCGSRFATHCTLERHINTHFKAINNMQQKLAKGGQNGLGTGQDGVLTPGKANKKRKRKRRQFKEVAGSDYFDTPTLDGVKLGLYRLETNTHIDTNAIDVQSAQSTSPAVTFRSTVISRRTEPSGLVKLLLHWTPENVLPDIWISESQLAKSSEQTIPLRHLPASTVTNLDSSLYKRHRYRKHRRK